MPGTIELTGAADFPACPCCGMPARRVWGNLIDADGKTAYVVQWAPGTMGSHAAVIGLIFGPWDDASDRADRFHVAIETRPVDGAIDGPVDGAIAVAIIDAEASPIDASPLAAYALSRDAVLTGTFAARALNYVEQIRVQDARVMGLMSA